MGVFDNIAKVRESMRKKNSIQRIGMEAVKQSALESNFINEYQAFVIPFSLMLQDMLVDKSYSAIEVQAKSPADDKYLKYLSDDPTYNNIYNVQQTEAGTFVITKHDGFEQLFDIEEDNVPVEQREQELDEIFNK